MATKAMSAIGGLRLLANSVRGLSVKHARLLYKTCVVPVLTYGSCVWFTGVQQKGLVAVLTKAQNAGLQWLLGAFKTSPISAMEHVASIPPMLLQLQRLSENAATRLNRIPSRSQVAQRLPPQWDTHSAAAPHPPTKNSETPTIIYRLARLSHPEAEYTIPYLAAPWESPHPWLHRLTTSLPDPKGGSEERDRHILEAKHRIQSGESDGSLLCFTDGSKRITRGYRKVGAGFSVWRSGHEISQGKLGLGAKSDIFDAEMAALAIAARRAHYVVQNSSKPPPRIVFSSDNQAAVRVISNLSPHPAQSSSILFRKSIDDLLTHHPNLEIIVQWVPGHAGIKGNERADAVANLAGKIAPTPLHRHTISWAKSRSKKKVVTQWGHIWRSSIRSDHIRTSLPYPPTWKLHTFHDTFDGGRKAHSRLIQVILGHGFFGQYYVRHNIPGEDPSCPCDFSTLQTIRHVLRNCPTHAHARHHLRKVVPSVQLEPLFSTLKGLRAIALFLSSSPTAFIKH